MNIRSRIRPIGIRCVPWRRWKGEIELLSVSGQTLFKANGLPLDLWEITLREEGYINEDESLLDILTSEQLLKREPQPEYDSNLGDFPDDWTEEDYLSMSNF